MLVLDCGVNKTALDLLMQYRSSFMPPKDVGVFYIKTDEDQTAMVVVVGNREGPEIESSPGCEMDRAVVGEIEGILVYWTSGGNLGYQEGEDRLVEEVGEGLGYSLFPDRKVEDGPVNHVDWFPEQQGAKNLDHWKRAARTTAHFVS